MKRAKAPRICPSASNRRRLRLPSRSLPRRARPAAIEHDRTMESLKRELGRLVVDTTAKVTGKVLTPEDQRRLQEEAAREVA